MRPFLYPRLLPVLSLLMALMLGGCTGGTSLSGGGTSGLGVAPAQTMTIFGIANVGTESLEGATVAVLADGSPVQLQEAATVKTGGHFRAVVTPVVPGGTWEVQITTRGGEVLRAEVEPSARSTSSVFVHVNVLTTLGTAYHALHPEMSKEQARSNVRTWLRIPSTHDIGDELPPYRYTRFAQEVYLRRARQHAGGFPAYTTHVAGLMGAPGPLGAPDEYNNDEDAGFDPGQLADLASSASTVAKIPGANVVSEFCDLAAGVGKVCSAIGTVFKFAKGIYDLFQPDPLQVALQTILSELSQISSQISTLNNQLTAEFNQTNYNTLAGQLANSQIPRITAGIQCVQNMTQAATSIPAGGTQPPDLASYSGYAVQLASASSSGGIGFTLSQIFTDATTIHNYEIQGSSGITALLTLASQVCGSNIFLCDPQRTYFQNHVNYYLGQQLQAASVISTMSAPAQIGTHPNFSNNFTTTPAFAANNLINLISWTSTANSCIADNIKEELSVCSPIRC